MASFKAKKKKRIKNLISKLKASEREFSREREFVENLFVGRFNYFMVVFSLFVTAGLANNFDKYRNLPFFAGGFFLVIFWIPLFRAYLKHDRTIKMMYNSFENHLATIMEEIMREEGQIRWFIISKWMGIYIPAICILSLFIAGIVIGSGWWY